MRKPDTGLLPIFTAALILRLAVALVWAPAPTADAADYDRLARGLVAGEGYVAPSGRPTSWRPPLYAGMMASVYAVAGERHGAVRVVQAVLGAATVTLIYALARWVLGPGPALVGAALAAIDLGPLFAVSRLLSETLFTFLLVLSVALLVRATEASGRPARAWGFSAGVVLGLGALTRGMLLLYPVALVPAWLAARKGSGRALLAVLAGFLLALSPWTVRNARVQHAFVPVATQGGLTLYAGNHPVDGWIFGLIPSDSTTRAAEALPESEASGALVRATARDLASHPITLPRLAALKTAFFWVPLDWEVLPWYGAFNPTYAFELFFCAFLGWIVLRSAGAWEAVRSEWPLWLPVVYTFALALVFYGSPRFRLPLEPLFALGAAAGLARLGRERGPGRALRWAILAAVAALCLTVAAGPLKAAARSALGS